eukprot:4839897-Prymnesium_polylepis.1
MAPTRSSVRKSPDSTTRFRYVTDAADFGQHANRFPSSSLGYQPSPLCPRRSPSFLKTRLCRYRYRSRQRHRYCGVRSQRHSSERVRTPQTPRRSPTIPNANGSTGGRVLESADWHWYRGTGSSFMERYRAGGAWVRGGYRVLAI